MRWGKASVFGLIREGVRNRTAEPASSYIEGFLKDFSDNELIMLEMMLGGGYS